MKHGRRDANHAQIVKAYRDLGCTVFDLADAALGCPDLLVGFAGKTCLVEVKTEEGTLTPKQRLFLDAWRGGAVTIVRTTDDVIQHVTHARRLIAYDNPGVPAA